jgi:hypothetical protein
MARDDGEECASAGLRGILKALATALVARQASGR